MDASCTQLADHRWRYLPGSQEGIKPTRFNEGSGVRHEHRFLLFTVSSLCAHILIKIPGSRRLGIFMLRFCNHSVAVLQTTRCGSASIPLRIYHDFPPPRTLRVCGERWGRWTSRSNKSGDYIHAHPGKFPQETGRFGLIKTQEHYRFMPKPIHKHSWFPVAGSMVAVAWGGNEFTPLLVMYGNNRTFRKSPSMGCWRRTCSESFPHS